MQKRVNKRVNKQRLNKRIHKLLMFQQELVT